MFVSTRDATRIKLLARPAASLSPGLRPVLWLGPLFQFFGLKYVDSHVRIIKQRKLFLERQIVGSFLSGARRRHADRVSGRDPFELVAGPNVVLVGNGFGESQLPLAGDLAHLLTLARIESLRKEASETPAAVASG